MERKALHGFPEESAGAGKSAWDESTLPQAQTKNEGGRILLEKLFHLLSGYVEFQVRGDSARFFTIAAKSRIGLWGYGRGDGCAVARIKAREYRRLRGVCRRSGARTRLLEKRGAPFQLYRLRRRKGLLVGAAGGIGLYIFLAGFLWGVSVTGTEALPDRLVLETAARYGICRGSRLSGVNPRGATQGILAERPQLSWAGINTDGCFMEIAVKEGQPKPEPEEQEGWSNIVAAREGQVVEIQAQQGRPEVSIGEAVQKGQLLISGLYQEEQDPWAEPVREPLEVVGPARGSVIAETYRTFTVQAASRKKEEVETGQVKKSSSLYLFGLRIPLSLFPVEGEGRRYRESHPLKALGIELPVSLDLEVLIETQQRTRALAEEEQRLQALMKLRQAQRAEVAPGGRVVEETLSYSFTEGACILEAKCRCWEEIGELQEVLVE